KGRGGGEEEEDGTREGAPRMRRKREAEADSNQGHERSGNDEVRDLGPAVRPDRQNTDRVAHPVVVRSSKTFDEESDREEWCAQRAKPEHERCQDDPPSAGELECDAERRAQEAIVLEHDAPGCVLVDHRAEIPHVAAHPAACVQSVLHAAADVESKVVLGSVLQIRPGANHAEPGGRVRTPLARGSNANGHHHVAHEADRVGVEVGAGTLRSSRAVGWRGRSSGNHSGALKEGWERSTSNSKPIRAPRYATDPPTPPLPCSTPPATFIPR